uniref:Uncharacterized protein n=1 Tax=Myotis myotis TaxID=51298 RepID=A0A7J7XII2_MYOMY|nr:hypothetical protein mMyoMyo1_011722 [Myotis myotis]
MHLPKLLSSCKTRGAPSGLCARCPRSPQVPSGLPCHEEDYVIPRCPGLSHVYTDHLHPWTSYSSQGNWNGWSPYMSPSYRLRPTGVLVSLPLSPSSKKRSLKDPQAGCIHLTNISLSPRLHPSLPNFQGHLTPTPTITPRGWEQSALREAPGNPMACTRQDIGLETGATS